MSQLVEVDAEDIDYFLFKRLGEDWPLRVGQSDDVLQAVGHNRLVTVSNRYGHVIWADDQGVGIVSASEFVEARRTGKEVASTLERLRLLDVPLVNILALNSSEDCLALCSGQRLWLFNLPSLIKKGHKEPTFVKEFAVGIRAFTWQPSGAEYAVVLSDGTISIGGREQPVVLEQNSGAAASWSPKDGSFIATASTSGLISVRARVGGAAQRQFQVPLKEALGREEGEEGGYTIRVDSLVWVRPDSIFVGCTVVDEDGEDDDCPLLLLHSISSTSIWDGPSAKVEWLRFSGICPSIGPGSDIVKSGSGPYLMVQYVEAWETAVVVNARSIDDHIVVVGWLDEGRVSVLEIRNDSYVPRIELRDMNDDNTVSGMCIIRCVLDVALDDPRDDSHEIKLAPCPLLVCRTLEGRLSLFAFARLDAKANAEGLLSPPQAVPDAAQPSPVAGPRPPEPSPPLPQRPPEPPAQIPPPPTDVAFPDKEEEDWDEEELEELLASEPTTPPASATSAPAVTTPLWALPRVESVPATSAAPPAVAPPRIPFRAESSEDDEESSSEVDVVTLSETESAGADVDESDSAISPFRPARRHPPPSPPLQRASATSAPLPSMASTAPVKIAAGRAPGGTATTEGLAAINIPIPSPIPPAAPSATLSKQPMLAFNFATSPFSKAPALPSSHTSALTSQPLALPTQPSQPADLEIQKLAPPAQMPSLFPPLSLESFGSMPSSQTSLFGSSKPLFSSASPFAAPSPTPPASLKPEVSSQLPSAPALSAQALAPVALPQSAERSPWTATPVSSTSATTTGANVPASAFGYPKFGGPLSEKSGEPPASVPTMQSSFPFGKPAAKVASPSTVAPPGKSVTGQGLGDWGKAVDGGKGRGGGPFAAPSPFAPASSAEAAPVPASAAFSPALSASKAAATAAVTPVPIQKAAAPVPALKPRQGGDFRSQLDLDTPLKVAPRPASPGVPEVEADFLQSLEQVRTISRELDKMMAGIESKGDGTTGIFQRTAVEDLERRTTDLKTTFKTLRTNLSGVGEEVVRAMNETERIDTWRTYLESMVKLIWGDDYQDLWDQRSLEPELEMRRSSVRKADTRLKQQVMDLQAHIQSLELNEQKRKAKLRSAWPQSATRRPVGRAPAERPPSAQALYSTINLQMEAAGQLALRLAAQMELMNLSPTSGMSPAATSSKSPIVNSILRSIDRSPTDNGGAVRGSAHPVLGDSPLRRQKLSFTPDKAAAKGVHGKRSERESEPREGEAQRRRRTVAQSSTRPRKASEPPAQRDEKFWRSIKTVRVSIKRGTPGKSGSPASPLPVRNLSPLLDSLPVESKATPPPPLDTSRPRMEKRTASQHRIASSSNASSPSSTSPAFGPTSPRATAPAGAAPAATAGRPWANKECVNASNPYHECSEFCSRVILQRKKTAERNGGPSPAVAISAAAFLAASGSAAIPAEKPRDVSVPAVGGAAAFPSFSMSFGGPAQPAAEPAAGSGQAREGYAGRGVAVTGFGNRSTTVGATTGFGAGLSRFGTGSAAAAEPQAKEPVRTTHRRVVTMTRGTAAASNVETVSSTNDATTPPQGFKASTQTGEGGGWGMSPTPDRPRESIVRQRSLQAAEDRAHGEVRRKLSEPPPEPQAPPEPETPPPSAPKPQEQTTPAPQTVKEARGKAEDSAPRKDKGAAPSPSASAPLKTISPEKKSTQPVPDFAAMPPIPKDFGKPGYKPPTFTIPPFALSTPAKQAATSAAAPEATSAPATTSAASVATSAPAPAASVAPSQPAAASVSSSQAPPAGSGGAPFKFAMAAATAPSGNAASSPFGTFAPAATSSPPPASAPAPATSASAWGTAPAAKTPAAAATPVSSAWGATSAPAPSSAPPAAAATSATPNWSAMSTFATSAAPFTSPFGTGSSAEKPKAPSIWEKAAAAQATGGMSTSTSTLETSAQLSSTPFGGGGSALTSNNNKGFGSIFGTAPILNQGLMPASTSNVFGGGSTGGGGLFPAFATQEAAASPPQQTPPFGSGFGGSGGSSSSGGTASSGGFFKPQGPLASAMQANEEDMEEEVGATAVPPALGGGFGGLGLGTSPSPGGAPKQNPFGVSNSSPFGATAGLSGSSLSPTPGQLFRPSSFQYSPAQVPGNSFGTPTQSLFGSPSTASAQTSLMGGSAFGQPSALGSGSSAFGQPSSLGPGGGPAAFGQPSAFGAFGQANLPGGGGASGGGPLPGTASPAGSFGAAASMTGGGFGAAASMPGGGFGAAASMTGGGFGGAASMTGGGFASVGSGGGFANFASVGGGFGGGGFGSGLGGGGNPMGGPPPGGNSGGQWAMRNSGK